MRKGYRIRIYPDSKQIDLINKHIGACRFIWNYMIGYQEENYNNGNKYLSGYDMNRLLTQIKHSEEYLWLNDVSCSSLQTVCIRLHSAYTLFFDGTFGHPRFKSKKSAKQSYPVPSNRFYFTESHCRIQCVGEVKYKTDLILPIGRNYKFYNVVLTKEREKYFISFCVEHESQVLSTSNETMGIDLGIKTTATIAYGDNWYVLENINKNIKVIELQKKLKYYQRKVSHKYDYCYKHTHKYNKSNNIRKLENKISKLYKRLTNIRIQYIHQSTHYLVFDLKPKTIVMEKLEISRLMKNKRMNNLFREQILAEFLRQMKYKCEWNGVEFFQVDRFYPSSKMCSCCGNIKRDLKLSDRTYVCNKCGLIIDRDYNAAINLKQYSA